MFKIFLLLMSPLFIAREKQKENVVHENLIKERKTEKKSS